MRPRGVARAAGRPARRVEHTVQRSRDLLEVERLDEKTRVAELPAIGAPYEASQLTLDRLFAPRRLLLESAERSKVALRREDGLHGSRTDGADQLVFQVVVADVEAQARHLVAGEVGPEASALEPATENSFLAASHSPASLRSEPAGPN